jgi:hypothetical protein
MLSLVFHRVMTAGSIAEKKNHNLQTTFIADRAKTSHVKKKFSNFTP